jgi:hypothetical protein
MGGVQPWHWLILIVLLLLPLACGWISSSIAKKKNRGAGGFFALGFFLGIIGIIIAAVVSPGQPGPPPGLTAVSCPRCNARQNIKPGDAEFECWRCKTKIRVGARSL